MYSKSIRVAYATRLLPLAASRPGDLCANLANISKNQTRLGLQARVTASGDLATEALGLGFRLGVLVFGA